METPTDSAPAKKRQIPYLRISVGVAITLLLIYAGLWLYQFTLPSLSLWHNTTLSYEFDADSAPADMTLADYQELEGRLFRELTSRIYDRLGETEGAGQGRFKAGSTMAPTAYPDNWNRTHELPQPEARAGVLLLHGLSDSPYTMRGLAERLSKEQLWVVALRLPGHGTTPSSLLQVEHEDWQKVVALAMQHLRTQLGADASIYMVGYSNGGLLAVDYALAAMVGDQPVVPAGLTLLAPALGVTPAAGYAWLPNQLSGLPGLQKLAWQSLLPPYDPYKYSSFTMNAATQIHDLIDDVKQRIRKQQTPAGGVPFPPTQVFASIADATVDSTASVTALLERLNPGRHHLYLYDINRSAWSELLFDRDFRQFPDDLLKRNHPFDVTLVTNADVDSRDVVLQTRFQGSDEVTTEATDLKWPLEIYSLSHTAVPFAPGDPIYGDGSQRQAGMVNLGRIPARGESALLNNDLARLQRLRYNPFYQWQEDAIVQAIEAASTR
ncbi:carboxylesterase [Pseudomaricurvus sp. HS19]|uniref:alpha/beta hydrolase n=1 Tax=Pseudomaricurvus sp. HS19 TaxID=2692626 RepID=UPI00136AFEAE|nr:alpha/beta fold hydrolase [Pseudomaricurvus sp. HS19]MYM63368.1 alpha/beta fold hydrolase [Pseudomaricurvus sp. HS19]